MYLLSFTIKILNNSQILSFNILLIFELIHRLVEHVK